MAYLEFSKDGKTYAEADGRMSGVRYRDCCGEKQRAFISFSVCYGYRHGSEFGDVFLQSFGGGIRRIG